VSAEIDEVLFYVEGEFTSRRGVEAASLTWHPAGLPHGPHPGRYEQSAPQAEGGAAAGLTRWTAETAVMLDCSLPLLATAAARRAEDADYEQSFTGD
jgi:homogentisate 1,2-dioxygenase